MNWPLLCCALLSLSSARAEPPKLIAYVPNWIDLKAFIPTIEFDKLTHLNLAFENPSNDEGKLSYEETSDLLIQAAHEHHVKILLSIGGGAASGDPIILKRYATLLSEPSRAAFIQHLVNTVSQHGFDGLDVDLEGPTITDDYAPFIAALSAALRPTGKLLSAALSQGYGGDRVPQATLRQFDFINIMAYDASGPWNPQAPGPHSSLAQAQESVDYWLRREVPASRLILGVPFYGYGFGPAFKKSASPYREILAKFPTAAQTDQIGDTIFYNGHATLQAKARLTLERKLGGLMIWSLDNDATGPASLLRVLHAAQATTTSDLQQ